ncbi:MAG: CBS domain-containing protein [Phycisphaerales bacterium]|nr:CBS domain-containing protein [Phycisphaerales bacterium]
MDPADANPSCARVGEVMTARVHTLGPDDFLFRAVRLFEREHFHHVVILEDGKILGVISDRDILKALSPFLGQSMMERPQDLATPRRRLHQVMSRKPVTIHVDQSTADAATRMLDQHVSCLPVVDDAGAMVGILSMRDLIAQIAGTSLGRT